ncbi:MAG: 50S ribosomal protein L29 [Lewinella sp.]|nr:50S ribosomal protein L29 [Lewinella sp.]
MATKKFLELQDFSDADLQAELDDTQAKYQKMKFDHAITGLDNPMLLREVRRDIARLQTEFRRRQLASSSEEELANRSRIRARRRRR